MNLLRIENLKTYFETPRGIVRAADGVSFNVQKGETVCLIGESGCGKTVSALSVLGLISGEPGIVAGEIWFKEKNLLEGLQHYCEIQTGNGSVEILKDVSGWQRHHKKNLAGVRGRKISMIFQDPVPSLNPLLTVGEQIAESLLLNNSGMTKKEALDHAQHWLEKVKIKTPKEIRNTYPFQLSGGMAQRVMIAVALASNPELLIADEPTTSLDATVQLEILKLLKSLQEHLELSILFITHDIGIGANMADKIVVMYAGRVVESGSRNLLFETNMNHPYTSGLLNVVPSIRETLKSGRVIKGNPPDLTRLPSGCKFHPRCEVMHSLPDGGQHCRDDEPEKIEVQENHAINCWYYTHRHSEQQQAK